MCECGKENTHSQGAKHFTVEKQFSATYDFSLNIMENRNTYPLLLLLLLDDLEK